MQEWTGEYQRYAINILSKSVLFHENRGGSEFKFEQLIFSFRKSQITSLTKMKFGKKLSLTHL